MPKDRVSNLFQLMDLKPREHIQTLEASLVLSDAFESLEDAEKALVLGRGYMLTGRFDMAEKLLVKALSYFESFDYPLQSFYTYINLGVNYRDSETYEYALRAFSKAYELSYEMDDFEYIILALVNLGSIYSSLDNSEKTIEYLEKAMEYVDKIPQEKTLGDLYNNYAYALMDLGREEEALRYYFKALTVYEAFFGSEMHVNRIIVISNIGETYLALGNDLEAERFMTLALQLSEENQLKIIELDAHRVLSEVYEKREDYKRALAHHKRYDQINEVFLKQKKRDEIEVLSERLEKEKERSREEIHTLRNVELKSKTTELEKTLKNLAQISAIGQKLTSSMDMDEIYAILRQSIYALMPVHVFGLAVYDPERETIIYKYFEEQGRLLPLLEISKYEGTSLAAYCILNQEDVFIPSFQDVYERYLPKKTYGSIGNDKSKDTQCIIYCRLMTEEGCVGLITMQNYEANTYKASDYEVVKALASYVAIAISNAQKKNIINEKAKALAFLSFRDPLTGLYNRRYFNQLAQAHEDGDKREIGLIMGDMNHLKQINDTYGHGVGDTYLCAVSDILKKVAGNNEVFRLGGDEFAILVHEADEELLRQMLEEIRRLCDAFVFEHVPLSISLGYELCSEGTLNLSQLFSRAESKMYLEKKKFHKNVFSD